MVQVDTIAQDVGKKIELRANFSSKLVAKPTLPLAVTYRKISTIVRRGIGHFFFDLGQEIQGGIHLKIKGNSVTAGDSVILRLGEQVWSNGTVRFHMRTGATYEDIWSLRDGQQTIEHHEYMEFRYGELFFRDTSGIALDIKQSDLEPSVWVVNYPWDEKRASRMITSSQKLNRVFAFNQYTMKATTIDLYTDSNARQRSADCMADDTTACQAQYATSGELALPRFMTEQIMDFAPTGDSPSWPWPTPTNTSGGTGGYVSPNWADWTVLPAINVVNDVLFTGDTRLGEKYFDDILKFHLYLDKINSDGLVEAHGLSALVDTSGGSDDGFVRSDVNAVVNAWVYYGITNLARLAEWIGRVDDMMRLQNIAKRMKKSFNTLLINDNGVVCDGLCLKTPHTAVHASFYALAFDLIAEENIDSVWQYIVNRIHSSPIGVPCGSYPVQFLLMALYKKESDRGKEAFNVITSTSPHSWLTMMDKYNATCTMECWLPEELPSLTFSHIWSSSPNFIIPWLLFGITALAPGFSRMSIKPQPGMLVNGNYTMPTIRGPVVASFHQHFNNNSLKHFELTVTTAGNVAARIHVPRGHVNRCILVDGQQMLGIPTNDVYMYVDVAPGIHTVEWCR